MTRSDAWKESVKPLEIKTDVSRVAINGDSNPFVPKLDARDNRINNRISEELAEIQEILGNGSEGGVGTTHKNDPPTSNQPNKITEGPLDPLKMIAEAEKQLQIAKDKEGLKLNSTLNSSNNQSSNIKSNVKISPIVKEASSSDSPKSAKSDFKSPDEDALRPPRKGKLTDEPAPEFVKQPVKPTRSFNKNNKFAEDAKKNDEPVIAKDDFKAGNTETQEEVVLR